MIKVRVMKTIYSEERKSIKNQERMRGQLNSMEKQKDKAEKCRKQFTIPCFPEKIGNQRCNHKVSQATLVTRD
jgi:hypothetical protein